LSGFAAGRETIATAEVGAREVALRRPESAVACHGYRVVMSDTDGGLGADPTFDEDEERAAALDAGGDLVGMGDGGESEIEGRNSQ
jgi:hypothetical protein